MKDQPPAIFAPNAVELSNYVINYRNYQDTNTMVQTNGELACDEAIGTGKSRWNKEIEAFLHVCALAKNMEQMRAYAIHGDTSIRVQMFGIFTSDYDLPNERRAWTVQAQAFTGSNTPNMASNTPVLTFLGYSDSRNQSSN